MEAGAPSAGADNKERLINAAAAEFSAHGYDGASLRQICAAAGVTTGALYFFFKNKEDLFKTVVSPVIDPIMEELERMGSSTSGYNGIDELMDETGMGGTIPHLLSLCYEHRQVVLTMVNNTDCPIMEKVAARARDSFARGIAAYVADSGQSPEVWDDLVVDWVAGVALNSLADVLRRDQTVGEARRHMRVVLNFLSGGARALRA